MKVGNDIVSVKRIKKVFSSQKRMEKCFLEGEIEHCEKQGVHFYESLAGMFAAKEAFLKALELGIGNGITFRDIEIFHKKNGAPQIAISKKLENFFHKFTLCELAISHCAEYAVAMVVLYSVKI